MNFREKPFNLNEDAIKWIEEQLKNLTIDEKIGQLFCLHGDYDSFEKIEEVISNYCPGGMMYRPGDSEKIQNIHRHLQEKSNIPMLLAANLESGGDGIGNDGTFFGRPIQVAATNDKKHAYRLGTIAGKEGAAVGCNWSFAPVVDINMNIANPITNVRTFGSNPKQVAKMAKEYVRGCQENNVAASIKHFPGDGVDDRDQHLLTSVNSLTIKEWDQTFGHVYQELIDFGVKTVMVGHIMQPAYTRHFSPEIIDTDIKPASVSPELLQGLLRGKLKFNGLVVTDASNMAGFSSVGKREDLVPECIAAGCDMLLFTRNLQEDYYFMKQGFEKGVITKARLDEAVARILATKASLQLHKNSTIPTKESLSVLKSDQHTQWAHELADESITLVKDTQNLIPINPKDYKKILVIVLGDVVSASGKPPVSNKFITELEMQGFDVERFDKDKHGKLCYSDPIAKMKEKFDLILYFANIKTASNQTTVRINWLPPMGLDMPQFVKEIPTAFVSIANPYHLQDVPMIKTYINAYTANEFNPKAIVEKLVGKSEFKGISQIDAFCGYWDTRL